jgi:hypothetical protein
MRSLSSEDIHFDPLYFSTKLSYETINLKGDDPYCMYLSKSMKSTAPSRELPIVYVVSFTIHLLIIHRISNSSASSALPPYQPLCSPQKQSHYAYISAQNLL